MKISQIFSQRHSYFSVSRVWQRGIKSLIINSTRGENYSSSAIGLEVNDAREMDWWPSRQKSGNGSCNNANTCWKNNSKPVEKQTKQRREKRICNYHWGAHVTWKHATQKVTLSSGKLVNTNSKYRCDLARVAERSHASSLTSDIVRLVTRE